MRTKDRNGNVKIVVAVRPVRTSTGTKPWAYVETPDGKVLLIPSFEDLFAITLAIVECENKKYEGRVAVPADFVRRFYGRCMDAADWLKDQHGSVFDVPDDELERVWVALANELQIPLARSRTSAPTQGSSTSTKPPEAIGSSTPPTYSSTTTSTRTPRYSCPNGCSCEICKEYPLDVDRSAA